MKGIIDKETGLVSSNDTGGTGIPHLKRLWTKLNSARISNQKNNIETELDIALLNVLGLGLLPTYEFFFHHNPSLEIFENWVMSFYPGGLPAEKIKECYALIEQNTTGSTNNGPNVLTQSDLAFWEEYGYVIVRNAVSQEDCSAARKAIWDYLKMDEHDPVTWYSNDNKLQGIMTSFYRHEAIDKNRNAARVKKAFEQVWKQSGLIVTTDKCGFNAPETATAKYKGTGLHWDVSLATPIPFGTQGILYLTDTAANQGALTLVPKFHNIIEPWLQSLPSDIDARQTDFSVFNPVSIAAKAGDFIIWDHRLPHGGSPNRADTPRLVQYVNWYSPLQKNHNVWK